MSADDDSSPPLLRAARCTGVLLDRLRSESCRAWPQLLSGYFDELTSIEEVNGDVLFTLLALVADAIRRLAGDKPCPLGDPLDRLLATWDTTRPARVSLEKFRETYLHVADPVTCHERECSARVRELTEYMNAHFAEPLKLVDLARRLRLQRNYAATLFRQETGVTMHRYLTRVRVARAAALLRDGEKVEAVMLLVGYRSKKSFYQHFQAEMGVTPGAYRLSARVQSRAS